MSFAAIGITSAVISTGLGAYSAISADTKQKRAQRNLEDLAKNSPLYKPDKSINDYYQQALNRFNENPYQSQQYQMGAMNARRATAQGLRALQDRRSAIGGISRLEAGQNYAMQNLGAQAEAQRNQRFNQFGNATQMKSADYQRQFDFNQMTPYNRKLQLEQMKGAAAGEQLNAGMQMIGQGLSAAGTIAASGYGGGVKNSPDSLSANASFDRTIGSPYGNFDKAYSPKINYSQYWKPSK
jgi:hypothetical protein